MSSFAHEKAAEELVARFQALSTTLRSVTSQVALPDERKAELVKARLKGGADVAVKGGWSEPAWSCAANDHVESLRLILDKGIDWDAKAHYGTLIETVQKRRPRSQRALQLLRDYERKRQGA